MRSRHKIFKEISPAYSLQILAVLFLFTYALSSPAKKTKEEKNKNGIPQNINNQLLLKASQDSLLNKKINDLKRYVVKHW